MKHYRWQIALAAALIAATAVMYLGHWLMFGDAHHIFIYLVGDIAFLPIEVLLVTLVLHQLLQRHEKHERFSKLNMVVGAFFSEVGNDLISRLSKCDSEIDSTRGLLAVTGEWSARQFSAANAKLRRRQPQMMLKAEQLPILKDSLQSKREFLLRLLENPNLLEHQRVTDLLWAVFHLAEELSHRPDLSSLPQSDIDHLSGDVRRVYMSLLGEWTAYMGHLKKEYPYLFSLALRTNPLNPQASAVVA
ncbi:MAG: hypothetical protein ABFD92_06810 [Planctomycetaceae bacterium]|nr:hypothetical protein [Planctomycetaceae bacterium]